LLLEQEALMAEAADINPWLESAEPEAQQPAAAPEREGAPKSATGSFIIDNVGPASLLDLINQSFEVMQTSLAQYKIAGYPPDILINVPKRVCRFFEFYKAPELIALGREIARDTLDRYERARPEIRVDAWPHRWQASSHRVQWPYKFVFSSSLWERACPRWGQTARTSLKTTLTQQPIPNPASVTINRGWVGSSASFWRKCPTTIRR
jgi:hypothetical protein